MDHGQSKRRVHITGAHKAIVPNVTVKDDVLVVVTQAYGPNGDSIVGISDVTFDGFPAVTVLVRAGGKEGLAHLSPVHGDPRVEGFVDLAEGTKCELLCPVSKKPLDRVGQVDGSDGAEYFAIYLTPRLSDGDMVAISDVFGDRHSRIIDQFELISYWADEE